MLIWLIAATQSADLGAVAFDLAAAEPRPTLSALSQCADGAGAAVVVCGRRDNRHRLPLPVERIPAPDAPRADAASGAAALTPPGRCGIFAGERRCGKQEAAEYGYGRGRDPVTVVTRLAEGLLDPD